MSEIMFHTTIAGDPEAAVKYGLTIKAKCGKVWVPTLVGSREEHPEIPDCPACSYVKPGYVYRCYDADGRLLYVGCSIAPKTRIEQHRKQSWWFDQVERVRFTVFPSREDALYREETAIYEEHPRWNVRGRDRGLWGVDEYSDAHYAMRQTGAKERRVEALLDEARRRGIDLEQPA